MSKFRFTAQIYKVLEVEAVNEEEAIKLATEKVKAEGAVLPERFNVGIAKDLSKPEKKKGVKTNA